MLINIFVPAFHFRNETQGPWESTISFGVLSPLAPFIGAANHHPNTYSYCGEEPSSSVCFSSRHHCWKHNHRIDKKKNHFDCVCVFFSGGQGCWRHYQMRSGKLETFSMEVRGAGDILYGGQGCWRHSQWRSGVIHAFSNEVRYAWDIFKWDQECWRHFLWQSGVLEAFSLEVRDAGCILIGDKGCLRHFQTRSRMLEVFSMEVRYVGCIFNAGQRCWMHAFPMKVRDAAHVYSQWRLGWW